MAINYHILGTCILRSGKFCKVLLSHLTEVFVTFVTSGIRIGSNFKTASGGQALTPKVS